MINIWRKLYKIFCISLILINLIEIATVGYYLVKLRAKQSILEEVLVQNTKNIYNVFLPYINHKSYIEQLTRLIAQNYDVNEELVLAIMWQESRFNPMCTSNKGAIGLMQLMPNTAKQMGVQFPYDVLQNLDGGIKYIKWLYNQGIKERNDLLIAYNWGLGNYKKYKSGKVKGLPKETSDYIVKVNKWLVEKPWSK